MASPVITKLTSTGKKGKDIAVEIAKEVAKILFRKGEEIIEEKIDELINGKDSPPKKKTTLERKKRAAKKPASRKR